MSNYKFIEPNLPSIPDDPNIEKYTLFSQIGTDNHEYVRNYPDYVDTYNGYVYLHSKLKNPTYKDFFEAYTQTHRELYDYAYLLRNLYSLDWYNGVDQQFTERLENILSFFIYTVPSNFISYINSDISNERDTDKEFDWIKFFVETIPFQKKWVGSLKAYYFPFKLCRKKGTVFLTSQYITVGGSSIYEGKYLRIIDYESILSLLPTYDSSVYPYSKGLKSYYDYSQIRMDYFKFDTGHKFDEEIDQEGTKLKFDTGITLGITGNGLMIDFDLEKIHYKKNTQYDIPMWLVDNEYLNAADIIVKQVKRLTDKVFIGSQISLVGWKDGRMTHTVHPSPPPGGFIPGTPEYEQEMAASYTHPNIRAKFQVFPHNYYNPDGSKKLLHYIKIGTGDLSSVQGTSFRWVEASDDPLLPQHYPTDIASPLFQTYIGQYENKNIFGWDVVTPTVHPIYINNKKVYMDATIYGSSIPNNSIPNSVFSLPSKGITPLSCSFLIKIGIDSVDPGSNSGTYAPFTFMNDGTKTKIIFGGLPVNFSYDDGYAVRFLSTGTLPLGLNSGVTYYLRRVQVGSLTEAYVFDTYEHAIDRYSFRGMIMIVNGTGTGNHYVNLYYNYYDRYIMITESFNDVSQQYETQTIILKKMPDGSLKETKSRVFSEFMDDSYYSTDLDYFPNFNDSIIQLLPILDGSNNPIKKISGEYYYSVIDHQNGKLKLRMKFDPNGILKGNVGNQTYNAEFYLTYSLNTFVKKEIGKKTEGKNIVAIREVGLFNIEDKMVAYGVFPPIIYDAEKFHLSFNLLIEG